MTYIQISKNRIKYDHYKTEFLLESDLVTKLRVFARNDFDGRFQIFDGDELLCEVGFGGYFSHVKYDIKKAVDWEYKGYSKGDLKITDDLVVMLDNRLVGKITQGGSLENWFCEMFKQKKLLFLIQWERIEFDEKSLDFDIALASVFLLHAHKNH